MTLHTDDLPNHNWAYNNYTLGYLSNGRKWQNVYALRLIDQCKWCRFFLQTERQLEQSKGYWNSGQMQCTTVYQLISSTPNGSAEHSVCRAEVQMTLAVMYMLSKSIRDESNHWSIHRLR